MKQVFDWLREDIEANSIDCFGTDVISTNRAWALINEAEAKWEADCCEWKLEDAEANLYVTSCEQRHLIFEDTPKENGYRFCPYCGRKILEVE